MRVSIFSRTDEMPQDQLKAVAIPGDLDPRWRRNVKRMFRPMLLAALVGTAALQGSAAHAADDPGCTPTNGFAPPCQFFPPGPGPSTADHSGNHDSEFFWILYNSYADEWNRLPPSDPNAPPTRRGTAEITPAPQTTPPYPFVDWPMGATQTIGGATPNSVDSPLMKALIGGTPIGKPLEDAHIQVYGWVDVGANVSTAAKGGFNSNSPVAYANTADTVQLDQAVLYIERVPDEVQKTSFDWGFRLAPIFGENYRYTTALGFFSNQFVYQNHFAGFDMPMAYLDFYVPWVMEGMNIRVGRYISIPDIEAQLAPNNYMYTHSITYTEDNYTNTGIATTIKLNKNWTVQGGLSAGTETFPWNAKTTSIPGYTGQRDPGTQPSLTGCVQWTSDSGADTIYPCVNSINNGQWGYNNLQWYGATYYHKFSDVFHVSVESYYEYERGVFNKNYTGPGFVNAVPGQPYFGTAFNGMVNPPNMAQCAPSQPTCTAGEYGILAYWNYRIGTFDNLSLRTEFYNDLAGQRTGFQTRYVDVGLGWQHWLGPQVEIRPEVTFYRALDVAAFDNGNEKNLLFLGGDMIWHF
jgi:hypothetical protein